MAEVAGIDARSTPEARLLTATTSVDMIALAVKWLELLGGGLTQEDDEATLADSSSPVCAGYFSRPP